MKMKKIYLKLKVYYKIWLNKISLFIWICFIKLFELRVMFVCFVKFFVVYMVMLILVFVGNFCLY